MMKTKQKKRKKQKNPLSFSRACLFGSPRLLHNRPNKKKRREKEQK